MSITNNELNVVSNLTNLISKSHFVQQPLSEKLSKSLLRSFYGKLNSFVGISTFSDG